MSTRIILQWYHDPFKKWIFENTRLRVKSEVMKTNALGGVQSRFFSFASISSENTMNTIRRIRTILLYSLLAGCWHTQSSAEQANNSITT